MGIWNHIVGFEILHPPQADRWRQSEKKPRPSGIKKRGALMIYGWLQKKNRNCQKKFCQILLNFYSLKRPFRI
jgi:hypothetical protein